MKLRKYQTEAIKSVYKNIQEGNRLLALVLCTGAGKTVIFSTIAKKVVESGRKVLIIAHRSELLIQAKEKLSIIAPDIKVSIEQGNQVADEDAEIIIASVQTLGRRGSDRIKKFNPDDFGMIIVDEVHHIVSSVYQNILTHFGANKVTGLEEKHPVVLGVTATPNRGDNVGLNKILDVVAYKYDMQTAISEGFLAPLRAFTVFTDTNLQGVKTSMGDFNIGELGDTVNNTERNLQIIETYKSKCNGDLCIVFAVNVSHAAELSDMFNNYGIKADYVIGEFKKEMRDNIFKSFNNGYIRVLINVGIAVEGYDNPKIQSVFLARPTKSAGLYQQMLGRGSRLSEGKTHFKVFDFVDNMKNNSIVTSSSLIGLSQPINADDTDIYEVKDKLEELLNNKPGEDLRKLDLDKIDERIKEVDIFAAAELDSFVKQNSKFSWTNFLGGFKISLGENQNKLEKTYASIKENILGKFDIEFVTSKIVSPTFQNGFKKHINEQSSIFTANTKEEAIKLADKVIKDNYSDRVNLVNQNSTWKRKSPSEKQIAILMRNGYPNAGALDAGQASQLISKIFNNKK